MNVWVLMQERVIPISVFGVILLASLILALAIWKNRQALPRILTVSSMIICIFLVLLSMYALVFSLSFGYNS